MKEIFIKSLYKTIVQEGKQEYKELLDNTNAEDANDKYWIKALQLYNNISAEDKENRACKGTWQGKRPYREMDGEPEAVASGLQRLFLYGKVG